MTALSKYARLEAPGVWRRDPDAQRRDVIVSFGDASLIIADRSETALSHWSLAAVVRINKGERPALYTPSAEGLETLEIEDGTMIDAIEQVRGAILKSRPRRGRLRLVLLGSVAALAIAAAAIWLPGALVRHTLSAVPKPLRTEIGTDLFRAVGRIAGIPCRTPAGDRALARLHARLLPDTEGALMVLPDGIAGSVSLPGGIILLNRSLVESPENPDVVAGYVLAEGQRFSEADPLGLLLDSAGLRETFRLLTTGHISEEALRAYAETLITRPAAAVNEDALLERFAAAGVASTPYAYAIDLTGESTIGLIEADPMRGGGARPALDKADWAALQAICGN